MQRTNYLNWFRRLIVLGAVVAGLTASAAMAVPVVDPQDGGTANVAAPVSRPPGIQDTGTALSAPTAAGLKADGMRLQGIGQAYQQAQAAPDVVRPPDVADTGLAVRYGSVSTAQSGGFDWNDWAIGIGSGLGIALLVGAALLMTRQLRHPVQTA